MDAPIELEREAALCNDTADDSVSDAAQSERPTTEASREPKHESVPVRKRIEEASFVVLESGRIRFFVRPRVEVGIPTSLEDVQTFTLTMTPRNRERQRRLSVLKNRLPDPSGRDMQWVVVDRVGPSNHVSEGAGVLEVATGTYAIASHRDHVHFLYELDLGSSAVPARLLRQLRIAPRTSYIAACPRFTGDRMRSRPSIVEPSSLRALDPITLEDEGTEFVVVSGGHWDEGTEPTATRRGGLG